MSGGYTQLRDDLVRLRRLGELLLWASLACALVLVLTITWTASDQLFAIPLLLLGAGVTFFLFRRPELNLYVVLGLFVLIMDYSEGLQLEEVLYGLYFIAFYVHWYVGRFSDSSDRLCRSSQDWALVLFVLFAAVSSPWGLLNGAGLRYIVGEAAIIAMLGFYFPVRELCSRSLRHTKLLLYLIAGLGVFVALRNFMTYRIALSSAAYLFQVTTGRVALNEILLMVPALGTLSFLLYSINWRQRTGLLLLFVLFLTGLVLTQSRGYWAAFVFGVVSLFVIADRKRKIRIVLVSAVGLASFVGLGYLFFPHLVPLVLGGVARRFVSLPYAFSSDISMISRLHETMSVWENIVLNPIIGYGTAAPFRYFNVIDDVTQVGSFTHNAFTGLWFKYGIVGLALVMFFWTRIIWISLKLFRNETSSRLHRAIGLGIAVSLIAELLVANTSTPFLIFDGMLIFALLGGVASGANEYVSRRKVAAASS